MNKTTCLLLILLAMGFACVKKTPVPTHDQAYTPETIRVTGMGAYPANAVNPAQAKLLAREAAIQDAYRQILERLYAVRLDANVVVRDAIAESVDVKSQVQGYVRTARILSENNDTTRGIYSVDMELEHNKTKFKQMVSGVWDRR